MAVGGAFLLWWLERLLSWCCKVGDAVIVMVGDVVAVVENAFVSV